MDDHSTRLIRQADNAGIAAIIRSVLTEFQANKPGTVYYDPTTDDLCSLFSVPNAEYHVLEVGGKLVGGSGIYPTPRLTRRLLRTGETVYTSRSKRQGLR